MMGGSAASSAATPSAATDGRVEILPGCAETKVEAGEAVEIVRRPEAGGEGAVPSPAGETTPSAAARGWRNFRRNVAVGENERVPLQAPYDALDALRRAP